MSVPCEKHALLPVVGQSPCAGCEIERLMAENVSLHAQVDTLAERHASALCEVEAMRKDAERYRWLRSMENQTIYTLDGRVDDYIECLPSLADEELDKAIDAAMSKDTLANPGQ